jgi:hypothetical protein
MSAIFKMAAKTRYKKWVVKIQHCPISSKFDMWVDNDVPTLKNFYRSRRKRRIADITPSHYFGTSVSMVTPF